MTINPKRAIIWPEIPAISEADIIKATLSFLFINPRGVRNCEVARALGVTRTLDPRNWFTYGILTELQARGWVKKLHNPSTYSLTPEGDAHLRTLLAEASPITEYAELLHAVEEGNCPRSLNHTLTFTAQ